MKPILFQTRVSRKLASFIERDAKRAGLSAAGWLRVLIIRAYNAAREASFEGELAELTRRTDAIEAELARAKGPPGGVPTCAEIELDQVCTLDLGHGSPHVFRNVPPSLLAQARAQKAERAPRSVMIQAHELDALLSQPHRPFRLSDGKTTLQLTNEAAGLAESIWSGSPIQKAEAAHYGPPLPPGTKTGSF
jgi:hypothetical protein